MGITTVVSAAYDTSGNGGRRLVRLSNGWLVSTAYNSAGGIHYFYKSTDNGQTWSQLCYLEETSLTADFVSQIAICSYGTTVYLIATMDSNGAKIYFQKFDAATQINTNISTGKITIDSQHNTLYGLSLAVSSDGSTLWGAWSSNNSRYSLSKNIRAAKATISGGTVTWESAIQVTTANTETEIKNPSVVIKGTAPYIFWQDNTGRIVCVTNAFITKAVYPNSLDANWGSSEVYYSGSSNYLQSNPCAVVDGNGEIHVVWHGRDDANGNYSNIRYSKSTDGGATWQLMRRLTSSSAYQQTNPTISIDRINRVYVFWTGRSIEFNDNGYTQIRRRIFDGQLWLDPENLTNNKSGNAEHVTVIEREVDGVIRWIYRDLQASSVKFDSFTLNQPPTLKLTSPIENILGSDGNCEDMIKWSVYSTDVVKLSNTVKRYGSSSFMYTNSSTNGHRYKDNILLDATKYYLAAVDVFVESYTSGSYRLYVADSGGYNNSISANTDTSKIGVWQTVYLKFTGKSKARVSLGNGSITTGIAYMDGVRIYEIDKATYDKIDVDPNYTGDKLAQKFPYTDPTISRTLSEGTTLSIEGTATEADPGNVLTAKYKINNGTPQALQSGVSDGSTPLSFAKTLTFRSKRLRDGTTDVTGADLAENVDHTLTVWAEDDQGGKSTEVVRKFRVIHNRAPIISDQDRNLGTIKITPSITYTVADPEENPFTITEKINGSTIRSYSGVPNRQETLTIPANKWLMLEPGVSHTLTITAADEQGKSSSRTFTFTRQVNEILFEGLQVPMETDIAAERILLTPDWQIPLGAEVRVEVCNNGFDAEPTWEDCTIPAKMGRGYAFLNTVKTAEKWGVNFRVRIQKGTATSEASLSGIGGAYDVHPSL